MSRLKTVDAARGLAEFWVLAYHALLYLESPIVAGVIGGWQPDPPNPSKIQPLLSHYSFVPWLNDLIAPLRVGDLGVAMFFVISGFCIHWPAARAGESFRFNLGHYVKRRFWRLYPTHFVAVAGSMAMAAGLWWWIEGNGLGNCVQVPWSAFWAHFAMLQSQLPSTAPYTSCYNPNLWSLETEFQLYACYILTRPLTNRIGWKRFLYGCLAISLAWMWWTQNMPYWPCKTCAIGHLLSWNIGAYIAECICRGTDPRPTIGWLTFATVFVAGVLPIALPFHAIRFMCAAVATSWILWAICQREYRTGLTFKGCDWFGWWGARSYSLYLWHAPILRVFVVLVAVQAPWVRNNYYLALVVAFIGAATSLYAARFSYWLVERHFIRQPVKTSAEPDLAIATV